MSVSDLHSNADTSLASADIFSDSFTLPRSGTSTTPEETQVLWQHRLATAVRDLTVGGKEREERFRTKPLPLVRGAEAKSESHRLPTVRRTQRRHITYYLLPGTLKQDWNTGSEDRVIINWFVFLQWLKDKLVEWQQQQQQCSELLEEPDYVRMDAFHHRVTRARVIAYISEQCEKWQADFTLKNRISALGVLVAEAETAASMKSGKKYIRLPLVKDLIDRNIATAKTISPRPTKRVNHKRKSSNGDIDRCDLDPTQAANAAAVVAAESQMGMSCFSSLQNLPKLAIMATSLTSSTSTMLSSARARAVNNIGSDSNPAADVDRIFGSSYANLEASTASAAASFEQGLINLQGVMCLPQMQLQGASGAMMSVTSLLSSVLPTFTTVRIAGAESERHVAEMTQNHLPTYWREVIEAQANIISTYALLVDEAGKIMARAAASAISKAAGHIDIANNVGSTVIPPAPPCSAMLSTNNDENGDHEMNKRLRLS